MKRFFVLTIFMLFIFLSCGEKSQKEINENSKESFYDGNFGAKNMVPRWLKNREFKKLEVLIKSDNQILLNSKLISVDSFKFQIVEKLEKIREDEYRGVLTISVGNDEDADYEFYKMILKIIKNSFIEEREKLCLKLFNKTLENASEAELQKIYQKIPERINELSLEINRD